jgi:MscS family membrane protein
VINISRRTSIRASFAVGVTYNTPSAKVKRAVDLLEEIYRAHPNTQDVIVHFNRFADYFLNLDILYWSRSTDWKVFCATVQDLNLTIKERFDAEGIEFAFPTRTLHVHSETRDDHGLAPGQGSAS